MESVQRYVINVCIPTCTCEYSLHDCTAGYRPDINVCALMTPHYRLLHRAVANVRPLAQRGAGKGCAPASQ